MAIGVRSTQQWRNSNFSTAEQTRITMCVRPGLCHVSTTQRNSHEQTRACLKHHHCHSVRMNKLTSMKSPRTHIGKSSARSLHCELALQQPREFKIRRLISTGLFMSKECNKALPSQPKLKSTTTDIIRLQSALHNEDVWLLVSIMC